MDNRASANNFRFAHSNQDRGISSRGLRDRLIFFYRVKKYIHKKFGGGYERHTAIGNMLTK